MCLTYAQRNEKQSKNEPNTYQALLLCFPFHRKFIKNICFLSLLNPIRAHMNKQKKKNEHFSRTNQNEHDTSFFPYEKKNLSNKQRTTEEMNRMSTVDKQNRRVYGCMSHMYEEKRRESAL